MVDYSLRPDPGKRADLSQEGFSEVAKRERDGTRAPDPSPTPPPGDGVAQERGFAESLGTSVLPLPSLRKRSFRGEGLGEGFERRTDLITTLEKL